MQAVLLVYFLYVAYTCVDTPEIYHAVCYFIIVIISYGNVI